MAAGAELGVAGQPIRCVHRLPSRDRASPRGPLIRAKAVVDRYALQLRKVARHVDDIIRGFDAATRAGQAAIWAHLTHYAQILTPWAQASADRMVEDIAAADAKRWQRLSVDIGETIAREIRSAPVAPVMERMKAEQVALIRSLPTEAAERVNRLVVDGLAKGTRPETVAEQIYQTGLVTRSRANTIARTETSRAATTLQMVRAKHVGSTHFRWRTLGDSDVRPSHRKLNNQIFAWDDPPVCDAPGIKALPGAIWNCRCYADPILD